MIVASMRITKKSIASMCTYIYPYLIALYSGTMNEREEKTEKKFLRVDQYNCNNVMIAERYDIIPHYTLG